MPLIKAKSLNNKAHIVLSSDSEEEPVKKLASKKAVMPESDSDEEVVPVKKSKTVKPSEESDEEPVPVKKAVGKKTIIESDSDEEPVPVKKSDSDKKVGPPKKSPSEPIPPIICSYLKLPLTKLLPKCVVLFRLKDEFKKRGFIEKIGYNDYITFDKETASHFGVKYNATGYTHNLLTFLNNIYKKEEEKLANNNLNTNSGNGPNSDSNSKSKENDSNNKSKENNSESESENDSDSESENDSNSNSENDSDSDSNSKSKENIHEECLKDTSYKARMIVLKKELNKEKKDYEKIKNLYFYLEEFKAKKQIHKKTIGFISKLKKIESNNKKYKTVLEEKRKEWANITTQIHKLNKDRDELQIKQKELVKSLSELMKEVKDENNIEKTLLEFINK